MEYVTTVSPKGIKDKRNTLGAHPEMFFFLWERN